MVVGEVAVVHQCGVERGERVSTAGMPDAALGRIALVADPHPGLDILHLVVAQRVLRVADEFQHQHVPAVRDHKRLHPLVCVERLIEPECPLGDELIFGGLTIQGGEVLVGYDPIQDIGLDPGEVPPDVGRTHLQPVDVPVVIEGGNAVARTDIQHGLDELRDDAPAGTVLEQRDLDKVIRAQCVLVHTHLLRDETCYRKPAAFTVAAVVHLAAGCQNMPAGDGDRADQADDAAAAFGFSFYETRGGAVGRSRSRGKTPAGRDELGDGLRRHVSLPELGSWKVGKLKG